MAFNYTKPAHETKYAGCLFRSRLEATWAAFFDLCGMTWVYEPFDIPGWSPDFLLGGKLLVEVKPITEIDEDVMWKIGEAAFAAGRKERPVLLGVSPLYKWWIDVSVFENSVVCDYWRFGLDRDYMECFITIYDNKEVYQVIRSAMRFRTYEYDFIDVFNEAKNKVRFSYSK